MKKHNELAAKILESLKDYGFIDSDLNKELSTVLPKAAFDVFEFISENGDENLSMKAIEVIAESGGEKVLPFLSEVASTAPSQLKSRVITAIGKLASTEAVPVLAPYLMNDDRRIRANAVEALSNIRDSCIIPLLLPLLEDDDNRVQANTAMALWQFQDQQDRVKATFEKMLVDGRKWKKASAYYAFGEIGLQDFVSELLGALDDPDEDLARNAVLALIGYAEHADSDKDSE